MTHDNYHAALKPKVQGTWNLHQKLPMELEFFILLSSTSGVIGNRGQSNYASGSTFQDAFARYRTSLGLKCISLDLGLMLGVGYAAERENITDSLRSAGYEGIHEIEFQAMLDYFCDPHLPIPSTTQLITGVSTPASLSSKGMEELYWMSKPIFKLFKQMDRTFLPTGDGGKEIINYGMKLKEVLSREEASQVIAEALVRKLSAALNMPTADIEVEKPTYAYGVDSLVAVEIRYWFQKEFKAQIAVFEIIRSESIEKLCDFVASKTPYASNWKTSTD
jgi:acyl carrier protein